MPLTRSTAPYSPQDLVALLPALARARIVVVGDIFLDEYIEGQATRLSREAPIPVLEFERKSYRPGGAANPAQNIVALQGQALQLGVIGADDAGTQLLAELRAAGIDPAGVVVDPARPTTTKTRVIARGSLRFPQQLARIDRLDRRPIAGAAESALQSQLRNLAPAWGALLLSDYRTGVATDNIIAAARASGRLTTVDTQGNLRRYAGFRLIKCNQSEAEATLGRELRSEAEVEHACRELVEQLEAEAVVITRGPDGIAGLSRSEGFTLLAAANRSEVYDVVGAGDTVIAVLTMGLAAGLPFGATLRLANYAAGLVVRKLGNATTTLEELRWAIDQW